MISILYILVAITVLFGLLLWLKASNWSPICPLCGAVSATWLILLGLAYGGYEINLMLVAVLMGGSAVGLLSLLEKKLPGRYHLFKLPFFLTLITLAYVLLGEMVVVWLPVGFLIILWIAFYIIYKNRTQSSKFGQLVKKAIACCRDW